MSQPPEQFGSDRTPPSTPPTASATPPPLTEERRGVRQRLLVAALAAVFIIGMALLANVDHNLPKAAADLVLVQTSPPASPPTRIDPGDKGEIRTPDFAFGILSVGEVDTVKLDQGPQYQAADNHKFVMVTFFNYSTGRTSNKPSGTSFAIDNGGSRTTLEGITDTKAQLMYALVSVPDDDSAKLVVSYAGVDQFYDLATGERTADPVTDTFYRPNRLVERQGSVDGSPVLVDAGGVHDGHIYPAQLATFRVTAWRAFLSPYSNSQGWAPTGSMWLTIQFQHTVNLNSGYYHPAPSSFGAGVTTLDFAASADGAAATFTAAMSDDSTSSPQSWGPGGLTEAIFSVPTAAQNVAITMTATLTFQTAADSEVRYPVIMSPVTVDATFPL